MGGEPTCPTPYLVGEVVHRPGGRDNARVARQHPVHILPDLDLQQQAAGGSSQHEEAARGSSEQQEEPGTQQEQEGPAVHTQTGSPQGPKLEFPEQTDLLEVQGGTQEGAGQVRATAAQGGDGPGLLAPAEEPGDNGDVGRLVRLAD